MESLMTLEEVAKYLRVSERTVKDWALAGELPGGKLGGTWRFRKPDIDNWLTRQLTPHKHSTAPAADYTLRNLLNPANVHLTAFSTKMEFLNFFIDLGTKVQGVTGRAEIADAVFKREELMSTGIGLGIAVPHVRLNGVEGLNIFMAVNTPGIGDYGSLDGKPVRIGVFFVVGRNQHSEYIKALASVMERLKNPLIVEQCLKAETATGVYESLVQGQEA